MVGARRGFAGVRRRWGGAQLVRHYTMTKWCQYVTNPSLHMCANIHTHIPHKHTHTITSTHTQKKAIKIKNKSNNICSNYIVHMI